MAIAATATFLFNFIYPPRSDRWDKTTYRRPTYDS